MNELQQKTAVKCVDRSIFSVLGVPNTRVEDYEKWSEATPTQHKEVFFHHGLNQHNERYASLRTLLHG